MRFESPLISNSLLMPVGREVGLIQLRWPLKGFGISIALANKIN